ncbi:MAG: 4a-hydroxytetrahydrobiopterin dehydratase [Bdellovibrio bacteriovorus]
MNRSPLDSQASEEALARLNAGVAVPWSLAEGKLHKVFVFQDFVHAFGFMTSAALVAESMNHHPEWCNVYNRVTVDLRTHDAGGITELDFALARRLEDLVP